MTKLSVNINKIATIRNARGGHTPSVVEAAINCQKFGADGITIHPRPDERHITKKDVYDIKPIITTEYNIEGYPNSDFMQLVIAVKPEQVTLVPDGPDVIIEFKQAGIRTSIFVDPKIEMIEGAKLCGTDRIELYTEEYATQYIIDKKKAISPYIEAANKATELGLGINAGHDLSLENLEYFAKHIPNLAEVSIGHALISDAIYLGLENTIQMYKRLL